MAIKKIFRAINTKGTPWDSPEDIEFLIYEDENGNTSMSLDGQTLNAEKISQTGDIGELEERVTDLEDHVSFYNILSSGELESASQEKIEEYSANEGYILPEDFRPESGIIFSDEFYGERKFEKYNKNGEYISSDGAFITVVRDDDGRFLFVYSTYNQITLKGDSDVIPHPITERTGVYYKDSFGRVWGDGDRLKEMPNVDIFVEDDNTITVPQEFYLNGTLLSNVEKIVKSITLSIPDGVNVCQLSAKDIVSVENGTITYIAVKFIHGEPSAIMVRLTLPSEMPADPIPVNIQIVPISGGGSGTPVVFRTNQSLVPGNQYSLSELYQGDEDFNQWVRTFIEEFGQTGVSSYNLILQTTYESPEVETPVKIPVVYSLQLSSIMRDSTPIIRCAPINIGGTPFIPVLTDHQGEIDEDLILTFEVVDNNKIIYDSDEYHKCMIHSLTYNVLDSGQSKTITFPSAITYVKSFLISSLLDLGSLFTGYTKWSWAPDGLEPNWYTCVDNKFYRCILDIAEDGPKIIIETSSSIESSSWTRCTINSLQCGQLTDYATNKHVLFYTVNE